MASPEITGRRPKAASTAATETSAPSNVDYTLRDRMQAAVERLEALADEIVAKLDQLEGDADLEPVLGALESASSLNQADWAAGGDVDEREAHDGDLEPSLGSMSYRNQTHWAGLPGHSQTGDLEDEHDGREPGCEDEGAQCDDEGADAGDEECSLGWSTKGSQGPVLGVGTLAEQAFARQLVQDADNVGDEHL